MDIIRHICITNFPIFEDTFSFSLDRISQTFVLYSPSSYILHLYISKRPKRKQGWMNKIFPVCFIQPPAFLTLMIYCNLVLVIPVHGCHLLLLLTSFFMLWIYLFPSSPHSVLECIKHIEWFWMAEYNYNARHTTTLNSSISRNMSVFSHHKNYLSYSSVILLSHFLFSLYPHKFPHLPDVSSSKPHTQIFSYYDQFPKMAGYFLYKTICYSLCFFLSFQTLSWSKSGLVSNSVHLPIRIFLGQQP